MKLLDALIRRTSVYRACDSRRQEALDAAKKAADRSLELEMSNAVLNSIIDRAKIRGRVK